MFEQIAQALRLGEGRGDRASGQLVRIDSLG
jgi:hypothetical protein